MFRYETIAFYHILQVFSLPDILADQVIMCFKCLYAEGTDLSWIETKNGIKAPGFVHTLLTLLGNP